MVDELDFPACHTILSIVASNAPLVASFRNRGRCGGFDPSYSQQDRRNRVADLGDARVLILATDGFEESELFEPRQALLDAGVTVTLASITTDPIQGVVHDSEKGKSITPDLTLEDVDIDDYDALLLPGGVGNPDKMRLEERAIEIVGEFMDEGKIVAAICHAPWLLVEADVVDGRRVTSWPSVRTDLENAGADVVDEEVVIDDNLITSRKPDDIPAFNRALLDALENDVGEED
jgi:protease I